MGVSVMSADLTAAIGSIAAVVGLLVVGIGGGVWINTLENKIDNLDRQINSNFLETEKARQEIQKVDGMVQGVDHRLSLVDQQLQIVKDDAKNAERKVLELDTGVRKFQFESQTRFDRLIKDLERHASP